MLKRDLINITEKEAHELAGLDSARPRYWHTAHQLIEDGYLPPVSLAPHLTRPKNPTKKHLKVLDSLIEALKVLRYREAEQRTRLQRMRKDLRRVYAASASASCK